MKHLKSQNKSQKKESTGERMVFEAEKRIADAKKRGVAIFCGGSIVKNTVPLSMDF